MSKVKFRASYIQNQKNRIFEIIQSSQTQDNEGHFADKSEIPNGKVWWLYDRPLITRSCYCPFLVSCPLLSKVRSLNFIFSYLLLPFWQSVIKLGIAAQRTLVDYGNWILAKSFPRPMNSKHQGGEGWVVPHIKHGSVNWIQGVGGSNFPARECQPSIKGSDCFVVARPKEGKRITESSQSKYTKERGKYQLGKT